MLTLEMPGDADVPHLPGTGLPLHEVRRAAEFLRSGFVGRRLATDTFFES